MNPIKYELKLTAMSVLVYYLHYSYHWKMLVRREPGGGMCGNYVYYLYNFSVNLNYSKT